MNDKAACPTYPLMKNPVLIFLCSIALLMAAFGQAPQRQEFSIKVGVEEVRIDAVVLDNKGRQVTDLTADDFEVYQDGNLQKITSCTYISDSQKHEKINASPEAAKTELLVSKPKLSKDAVRRAIVFRPLLGYGSDPRPSLKNFVESQMETGDLVAILGAGPQKFISDKRELMARIKSISAPRGGYSCVDSAGGGVIYSSNPFDRNWYIPDEFYIRQYKAALAPIRYAIRALQEMPGRKYLVLMSNELFSEALRMPTIQNRLINEVANEAWRAGVVVLTWDLCHQQGEGGKSNPLYRKTGGIYTSDTSFLVKGIPALNAIGGYYLISYIPPANTFESKRQEKYHKIKVNVKRSGTQVHSRDGFFGAPGASDFAAVPQTNTLQRAMFSPLVYNDLKLSLTSGYAHTPASGYFLRSWMHLDGKDLTFKVNDGEHSLSLELQALTSDSNGVIQDTKGFRYDFILNDADIARIRKTGIDLKIYLPVKNPGNYYVSAAIRDKASGKIGTGYQFLEIPDLSKVRLSLSSIFVLNNEFDNEKDEAAIKSGDIKDNSGTLDTMRKWRALVQSPAVRTYEPGESFDYMTVVYNAKNVAGQAPKLEFRYTLFKDGQIYRQEEPEDINLNQMDDLGRIPIVKKLVFDSNMDDGDYLLQLTVADKPSSEKRASGKSRTAPPPRIAVQAIDFQIRKE